MTTYEKQNHRYPFKRKVTEDLIKRLEQMSPLHADIANSELSDRNQSVTPKQSIKEMNDRLENEMVETLKRYKEDIHGKEVNTKENEDINNNSTNSNDVVCSDELAQSAFRELQSIVDNFNNDIKSWHERRGCVVNFSWIYTPHKQLEIAGIDCIIYRKPPPSPKTMKEIIEKGDPQK